MNLLDISKSGIRPSRLSAMQLQQYDIEAETTAGPDGFDAGKEEEKDENIADEAKGAQLCYSTRSS